MKILLFLTTFFFSFSSLASTANHFYSFNAFHYNSQSPKINLNKLDLNKIHGANSAYDLANEIAKTIANLYDNYHQQKLSKKLSSNDVLKLKIFTILNLKDGKYLNLKDKTKLLNLNTVYQVILFVNNLNPYFTIMNQPHKINLKLSAIDLTNLKINFQKSLNFHWGWQFKNYLYSSLQSFYNNFALKYGLIIKTIDQLKNDKQLFLQIFDNQNHLVTDQSLIVMSSSYHIVITTTNDDHYFQAAELDLAMNLGADFLSLDNLSFNSINFFTDITSIRNQIYHLLVTTYNNWAKIKNLSLIQLSDLTNDQYLSINIKRWPGKHSINNNFKIQIIVLKTDLFFVSKTYNYQYNFNLVDLHQLVFKQSLNNNFQTVLDWRNYIYQKIIKRYNQLVDHNLLTLNSLEKDTNISTIILQQNKQVKDLTQKIDLTKTYTLVFNIKNNDWYFLPVHYFMFIRYKMNFNVDVENLNFLGISAKNGQELWSKLYATIVNQHNNLAKNSPFKLPLLTIQALKSDKNFQMSVKKYYPKFLYPSKPIPNDSNYLIPNFKVNVEVTMKILRKNKYFNFRKDKFQKWFWIKKFSLANLKPIRDNYCFPITSKRTLKGQDLLERVQKSFADYINKNIYKKNVSIDINYMDLEASPYLTFKILNNNKVITPDQKIVNFDSDYYFYISTTSNLNQYFFEINNFNFDILHLTEK